MTATAELWTRSRLGAGLLALAAGWTALIAWSGMVASPRRYLVGALVIGLAMTLTGAAVRALRAPSYVAPVAQVVAGLLGLNVMAGGGAALLGIVPTRASVQETWFEVFNGAATLNTYSSPVQVNPISTGTMLAACGLLVLLAVDVLALTMRRAPLAALPLLAALSVPVSILREGLALPVFVIVALLFLRLLASDHLESFVRWGRSSRPVRATMSTFWVVSVAAVVSALMLTPLVPVSDLLDRQGTGGDGSGPGSGFRLTTVNPFITLRTDLVEKTHTPLVYATTDAPSTEYLRTTVLDDFTSTQWRPLPRDLPSENDADGVLPDAPGLRAGAAGTTSSWELYLDGNFSTSWLPLPYPTSEIDIGQGWRYDARTLDVAYPSGRAPTPLRYRVKSFSPEIDAATVRKAVSAPASLQEAMTELPDDFPQVIRDQAERVTRGTDNDFDAAVALQDWFRTGGGFTYSLEQRGGSGMRLLADFVTDQRIGYCEQFASAMAAMGRSLGIPSRVAVGFLDGSPLPDGRILYTSDERHAWTEMYFAGAGWVRFEPTPSQRVPRTPDYTQEQATNPTPSAQPSATPSTAPQQRPEDTADLATDPDGGLSIPWKPVGAVLLVLVLAITPGSLRRWQRRRRLDAEDPAHLAEGAWAELGATAVDLGLEWPEHRSPREQARRTIAQVGAAPDDVTALEGLLGEVERGRYAPGGSLATLDPEVRDRTVSTVESWRGAMAASAPRGRWSWLRRRWWPRSLVRSLRR